MKPLVISLLCLLLLGQGEACAHGQILDFESQSLDMFLADFMDSHGLTEENCAMGWLDLTTGESWYFQADRYKVVGSMYKLPLNMVVTDKLAAGELTSDTLVGGYQVRIAQTLSIVYSDNDATDALEHALSPDHTRYRELLASYSCIPLEELPEGYYRNNEFSPRFMIGTLQTLYENSGTYEALIEDLKVAHPGRYFQSSQTDYAIAHKYGYYEGALADCAIVYTPRPFALVALLSGNAAREEVLGDLCALMTAYAEYLETLPTPTSEPTPASTPTPESAAVMTTATPAPTPQGAAFPAKDSAVRNTAAFVCCLALSALLARFLLRKRK